MSHWLTELLYTYSRYLQTDLKDAYTLSVCGRECSTCTLCAEHFTTVVFSFTAVLWGTRVSVMVSNTHFLLTIDMQYLFMYWPLEYGFGRRAYLSQLCGLSVGLSAF